MHTTFFLACRQHNHVKTPVGESFHIDILSRDSAPGTDAPTQKASHGKEIKRAGFIQNSRHENFIPDLS